MALVGRKVETTIDNFAQMVRGEGLLVDKTRMIYDFWEGQNVSLITRPRRFGKTTNLSMLQHFFAAEVDGRPTQGLFDKFMIANLDNGEFLKTHQGQYPVIFISLKDVKEPDYSAAISSIRHLIKSLYREHKTVLISDYLDEFEKNTYQSYLQDSVSEEELQFALKFLSEILYKTHQKEVIILIDEYDAPITSAYEHGFLNELSDFMRNMLSAALKTNPYLKKGLMTGILKVSKNTMLSGLNNLKIYTLFDDSYSPYFGFTEDEVKELIDYLAIPEDLTAIRAFYNGYQIGGSTLYNPWSIMNFLSEGKLAPYWLMTSNDKLLKNLLINTNDDVKQKMNALIRNMPIEAEIDINLRYEELIEKPHALWTLLLFCGYLKIESARLSEVGLKKICQLSIPNNEIKRLYNGMFSEWLQEQMGRNDYSHFLKSLVNGDVENFTRILGEFLLRSLSVRDVAGNKQASERFYHGFFVGLTASLQEYFNYSSNQESGLGYYDVGLIPRDTTKNMGIILEFKHAKREQDSQAQAESALGQIDQMHYEAAFASQPQIQKLLKIGLAFCDKSVMSAYKITDLKTQQHTNIQFSNCISPED